MRLTLSPRYTFPIPIPASHTFFLSELDYKDGFVHLSTGAQVSGTLSRFFADVPSVVLLKLETDRVGSFKRLSWDENNGQSKLDSNLSACDENPFKAAKLDLTNDSSVMWRWSTQ